MRSGLEWDKLVEATKKDSKIVIAIPPSNELRKELEVVLKQKFGIEAELVAAPGPKNASRIAAEKKAGVNYFDANICGTGTAAGPTHDGMLEPLEPLWLLPEVRVRSNGGAGIFGRTTSARTSFYIHFSPTWRPMASGTIPAW